MLTRPTTVVPSRPEAPPPVTPRRGSRRANLLTGGLPEVITPREAAPQRQAQPWMPVISAIRRRALIALHHRVAQVWSSDGRLQVTPDLQFKFDGLSFGMLDEFVTAQMAGASVTSFAIGPHGPAGLLLISSALAEQLVRWRLGAGDRDATGRPGQLTRLEATLAQKISDELLEGLTAAYAAAIGVVRVTSRGAPLAQLRGLAPEDHLIVFRYRLGVAPGMTLTVAVHPGLIDLIRAEAAAPAAVASSRVRRLMATVPVRAAVVLAGWTISLGELSTLALGDEIILPPLDDARIEADGLELRRVRVEVTGERLRVRPLPARIREAQRGEVHIAST